MHKQARTERKEELMAHDVFISYSHKDSNIADAVCNRLERGGIRCWYAPRNIQPGHEWAEDIINALGQSKIMVLIFTDSSNDSTQVKREVSTAVSSGVTIIPFKCTDSEPSGSMQYYLSTLHWMDAMTDTLDASIAKLYDECRRILGLPENQTPIEPVKAAPEERKKEKKFPLWAVIVGAAIIAAVLCIILIPNKENNAAPSGTETQTAQAGEAESETDGPLTQLIKDQVIPAESGAVESIAAYTEPAVDTPYVPIDPSEFGDDPDKDSPGAEFYLYDVSSAYSDVYEKGVCLQKYFGDPAEVIELPQVVDGWPVTSTGEKCFEDQTTITKVVLPETIETIGYRSFYGCTNLTDINFPDSLRRTNGWTFAHSGLKEFIAPEGFTYLGYGTFYSCESLKNVVLTPAVSSLGADTFGYIAKGATVTVPNPDIEVDIKAFREDQDVTVIAPESSYLKTYAKAMNIGFQPME